MREISGDSERSLDTVGQDLRAARLRRGDDLATVSRALKIRKDHLEAVEEDRLENLPGRTYAIGFVRTYAGYLGLDATEMVERYKQEISGRHDEHTPTIAPMPDETRRLPQGWRFVAGIVVLGGGLWRLASAVGRFRAAGGAAAAVARAAQSRAAPRRSPSPRGSPRRPRRPVPAIDNAAAAATPACGCAVRCSGPCRARSRQSAGFADQRPRRQRGCRGAQPGHAESGAVGTAAADAAATVYGKNNRNARVVLKAKGDTHITVRGANGTVYINRNLKAGDTYQLPNAVGLTLSTTNAGAVELNLDGQAMGVAGGVQQSADDVPLDPQAIADRFHH